MNGLVLTQALDVVKDCDRANEYLNMSGELYDWKCNVCPQGGYCVGEDVTWKDVKPSFGYWRIEPWSEDASSNFSECLYPLACLGGTNFAMRGKFVIGDIDYAMKNGEESCNVAVWHEMHCTRDPGHRCRVYVLPGKAGSSQRCQWNFALRQMPESVANCADF